MTDPTQMQDDLRYVRGLLEPSPGAPGTVAMLWAVLGAPGFALVDLAPSAVPWYWLIAAPVGFAASIYLGWRAARQRGQLDRESGLRWTWHWGGLLAAAGAVVLLAVFGPLPHALINPIIVVLIATAYFLAGVHLDRRLLWVAAALALALPVALIVPDYGWTVAGALTALALVGVAMSGRRRG